MSFPLLLLLVARHSFSTIIVLIIIIFLLKEKPYEIGSSPLWGTVYSLKTKYNQTIVSVILLSGTSYIIREVNIGSLAGEILQGFSYALNGGDGCAEKS